MMKQLIRPKTIIMPSTMRKLSGAMSINVSEDSLYHPILVREKTPPMSDANPVSFPKNSDGKLIAT